MKNLYIICTAVLFSLVSSVYAQTVVKVKGNKVYFKKQGYVVKVGEELVVLSNGTDAASIEVLKSKRKLAVGRIVNGTVKKGYKVQLKKKSRRSKRARRNNRNSDGNFKAKMYGYTGIGFYLLGEIELSDGSQIDLNNHMVLPLGFEVYFNRRLTGTIEFVYAFTGGANPTNLAGDRDEWDSTYYELNTGLTYFLNRKFYVRGGVGYTAINISGSNISGDPNFTGDFDFDLSGLNFGFGGGMKIDFTKKMFFKIDAGYRYTSLSSGTVVTPQDGTKEGNPGLSQGSFSFRFLGGLKF